MESRILIEGLVFDGRHGLLPAERDTGVRLRIDLELEAELTLSSASDKLADTVDYREVAGLVQEIVVRQSFHLVETLGTQICRRILADFTLIGAVHLTLRKLVPVMVGHPESVGVRISLRR